VIEIILFILGFVLLVKGADYLVDGSENIAHRLNVPTLVIGMTIVALGTSLPELVVNIFSALNGVTDIALGNIIGSNIANTFLILGIIALIKPIKAKHSTVWYEIPFNTGAAVLLTLLISDKLIDNTPNILSRVDGLVLIGFLIVFCIYISFLVKNKRPFKEMEDIEEGKIWMDVLRIVGGLVALFIGGRWVVSGAITLARFFNISEFVIAATVVALGTSLPELVTALAALKKDHTDLILGNVVGSNILNIVLVLAITTLISPIPAMSIGKDVMMLILSSFLLMASMFLGRRHTIDRFAGTVFLGMYGVYIFIQIV